MIVIDSSGWLEMFLQSPQAADFERWLHKDKAVIVPTVVLHEVYKVMRRLRAEEDATGIAQSLQSYEVAPLTAELALEAADCSLQHHLATADAIIYATAQAHEATLVTSDQHFEGLPGVEYLPAEA